MRTISGLFDTHAHALEAVRALRHAGVPSEDISLVVNNAANDFDGLANDEVAEGAGAGAGVGAVIGGTGGLLAGLGALAIPGIGPVVAGGWLLSAAVGAMAGAAVGGATGGLIAALTEAGIGEADAHVYAEGIRRGGALVTARVPEGMAEQADIILHGTNRVNLDERRRDYQNSGWTGFDDDAPPYSPDQVRQYRDIYATRYPPII